MQKIELPTVEALESFFQANVRNDNDAPWPDTVCWIWRRRPSSHVMFHLDPPQSFIQLSVITHGEGGFRVRLRLNGVRQVAIEPYGIYPFLVIRSHDPSVNDLSLELPTDGRTPVLSWGTTGSRFEPWVLPGDGPRRE